MSGAILQSNGLFELDLGFFLIAAGCWLAAVALFYATPAFARWNGLPVELRGVA